MSMTPYVMMAALWLGVGALSALEMAAVSAGWAAPLPGLTWLPRCAGRETRIRRSGTWRPATSGCCCPPPWRLSS